jgi:hypothetical protein
MQYTGMGVLLSFLDGSEDNDAMLETKTARDGGYDDRRCKCGD